MKKFLAVLASVRYPGYDINKLENYIENIEGVSEFSLNKKSGNALFVFDKTKTNFLKIKNISEDLGVSIIEVLTWHEMNWK